MVTVPVFVGEIGPPHFAVGDEVTWPLFVRDVEPDWPRDWVATVEGRVITAPTTFEGKPYPPRAIQGAEFTAALVGRYRDHELGPATIRGGLYTDHLGPAFPYSETTGTVRAVLALAQTFRRKAHGWSPIPGTVQHTAVEGPRGRGHEWWTTAHGEETVQPIGWVAFIEVATR